MVEDLAWRVATVEPPLADLVVRSSSVNDNSLGTGDSFTLSVTVANDGAGNAPYRPTLQYYRSNNATVNASDTEVGAGRTDKQKEIGALFAGQTRSHSIRLTAPSAAGTYYYGACLSGYSSLESDARTTARNRTPWKSSSDRSSRTTRIWCSHFTSDARIAAGSGRRREWFYGNKGENPLTKAWTRTVPSRTVRWRRREEA